MERRRSYSRGLIVAAAAASLLMVASTASAADATMPVTFTLDKATWKLSNASGGVFNVSNDFGIEDASFSGPPATTNAFDGAFALSVNLAAVDNPDTTVDKAIDPDDNSVTITSDPISLDPLSVQVQDRFAPVQGFGRVLYSFTNGGPAKLTLNAQIGVRHGNVTGIRTTSGDAKLTKNELWYIADGGSSTSSLIVRGDKRGKKDHKDKILKTPSAGETDFVDQIHFTLKPGATARILYFVAVASTSSFPLFEAVFLPGSTHVLASAAPDIPADERHEIINWKDVGP